jgi:hypothetical protein
MKKALVIALSCFALVFMVLYGCSKSSSPSSPAAPAATATFTNTVVQTSTPILSGTPDIAGTITVPSLANGKQLIVVVDIDPNTANGNSVAQFVSLVNSTSMLYEFQVTPGSYYVFAYVDMNGNGVPDGTDYFGAYGSLVTTINTAVDFSCTTLLDILLTMNITVPTDCTGKSLSYAFLSGKDYDALFNPAVSDSVTAPSGTQFVIKQTMSPSYVGTYYFVVYVDANDDCFSKDCLPAMGDYMRVYGASMTAWPASPNLAVNGDVTVDLSLDAVVANVSGTMTLPGSASSHDYTIFVTTQPMAPGLPDPFMITRTAQAGSGSTINYSLFVPVFVPHYIMGIVDMDGSGWSGPTGPVTLGDYAGLYGVTPPFLNWMSTFPAAPNAGLTLRPHRLQYPRQLREETQEQYREI